MKEGGAFCIGADRVGVGGTEEVIDALGVVGGKPLIRLGGRLGGVGTGLGPPLLGRVPVCGDADGWDIPPSGA